jgi:hypothetical protein
MPALRELQAAFRAALLEGEHAADGGVPGVLDDGLTAAARLRIYRHHVFTSLTAALAATFPVVRALVGEGFFGYMADAFIRRHPPAGPCLAEYGGALPEFLAGFPPCRDLAYLPDVARLEWALDQAMHADDAVPLDAPALAALPAEALARARFRLDPSLALVASPWPLDRIWRAARPGADPETAVDLAAGGVHLAVRRLDDDAAFHPLAPATFALWQGLAAGRALEDAAEAALAVAPDLDLSAAIHDLISAGVLVAIDGAPPAKETP